MSDGAGAPTVVAHSEIADDHPNALPDLERWRLLAERALATEGVVRGELNLVFIDSDAMAELNIEHMEGSGPTDVLAFPIDGEDPEPRARVATNVPVLLGDVVVCPEVAARNAAERGIEIDDELALLVVHGVLHVLGHDHAEADETAVMKAREQALLAAHHRTSPRT